MNERLIEIVISPDYLAAFAKLPRADQKRVVKALRFFERNPNHASLRLKKRAADGLWEISFSREGRILFQWEDERARRRAIFLAVGHHKIVE